MSHWEIVGWIIGGAIWLWGISDNIRARISYEATLTRNVLDRAFGELTDFLNDRPDFSDIEAELHSIREQLKILEQIAEQFGFKRDIAKSAEDSARERVIELVAELKQEVLEAIEANSRAAEMPLDE